MTEANSDKYAIASRLQFVRLQRQQSQEDFAEQLGVTNATYLSYERGEREVTSSVIVKLMQRCAIDPAWFLTGRKRDTIADDTIAAAAAFQAILEAAQRASVTLTPEAFAYTISAAVPTILNGENIEPSHADVLVKLATIKPRK
ncbi:helix-turn-helix domain-containing protein [Rhizobium rhizogenes]|uniref:helix-turn-helix domain-containing protein n=1 Tax=Rhizobium rhizogenes TaxID=359 RepID=UPI0022718CCC|nr:helix-turn-helix transcriptional regulator [Rhizobium rhizogenes]